VTNAPAALSGSKPKASGSAGGYLHHLESALRRCERIASPASSRGFPPSPQTRPRKDDPRGACAKRLHRLFRAAFSAASPSLSGNQKPDLEKDLEKDLPESIGFATMAHR
jgi:hypothetical protein